MEETTWGLLALGLIAGILGGMFGIGGGLVMVLLLKFDDKKAVGTSLATILFPVGILGVIATSSAWSRSSSSAPTCSTG